MKNKIMVISKDKIVVAKKPKLAKSAPKSAKKVAAKAKKPAASGTIKKEKEIKKIAPKIDQKKKLKTAAPKAVKTEEPRKIARYWESIGRRKEAAARVRISKSKKESVFLINNRPGGKYFTIAEDWQKALSPLNAIEMKDYFLVTVRARGGGIRAQAEAVRHGLAKALVEFDGEYRSVFSRLGYLTRDSRMRERKKFGLKRARRAPQWQKR